MQSKDLSGIYPALPTPAKADGRPDFDALREMVEFNLSNGAAGLVPMGGTGEYTAFSPEDRALVVRHTVEAAAGRVPVVPGVLSPGFAEAVSAGESFMQAGADGLMVITPFYVSPTQEGLLEYFRNYRRSVKLPIVYYDVPSRTGVVSHPDTVRTLVDEGAIIGMKVCNTDAHYFNCLADRLEGKVALLSGDDMLFPVHMMFGATGGVLASAPMLPQHWIKIYDTFAAGRFQEGIELHRKLLPLFKVLFSETNPGPLKLIMEKLGHKTGHVAAPLMRPKAKVVERLEEMVAYLRTEKLV
jgi:4-hydroxy-tetrahydrodipicolinate synthase